MLDISLVRDNTDVIRNMLMKRNLEYPLDNLLDLDKRRRNIISKTQEHKRKRNLVSDEIAKMKKQNSNTTAKILDMKEISMLIVKGDQDVKELDETISKLLARLPNVPHESVPEGYEENDNLESRRWGEPRSFDFRIMDHIDLSFGLGLVDVDRAAKVAGSRFYFLKGDIVKLNYALINFALDFMKKRGWTLIQPPYMLNEGAISGTIILSDFEDVIYKIEGEDLYLIGTSEHAIASMHMNEIIDGDKLPLRYAGVSTCFRKEAGAHGRDTKGIFRVHQFEKVEQFVFSKPEDSWKELELLINNAEDFFKALELPYRVVTLCGGELGNVSAKTYDLEAWFPSQNKYREVVSCSNCTDYQARGLLIKYRDKPHESSNYLHTLNGTLVATERTLLAILENYQTKEGTIIIPKALQPYIGDTCIIKAQ